MVCIFFIPIFTAVYIVEWLVLQTIYVLNKKNLIYRTRAIITRGLYNF